MPCKIIIKRGNNNIKLILLKLTILPISTRQSIFKIKTVGMFIHSSILIGSILLTVKRNKVSKSLFSYTFIDTHPMSSITFKDLKLKTCFLMKFGITGMLL